MVNLKNQGDKDQSRSPNASYQYTKRYLKDWDVY